MVRFKNRYILADLPKQDTFDDTVIIDPATIATAPQQRALLGHIK